MVMLHPSSESQGSQGTVYLIGAGPGDPDLITIKAARLLRKASIVFYDSLVSSEVLKYCRRTAELHYVGKRKGQHSCKQEQIHNLLARAVKSHETVVRLKGGDPSIFGRSGEECSYLLERGIPYEIVPGITAASGMAASQKLPLTHRDYAREVLYVSGHKKDGPNDSFHTVDCSQRTLVVYMGLSSLPSIVDQLMQGSNSSEMPAAVIQNATLKDQKMVTGKLSNIASLCLESGIGSPALLVVGHILDYHSRARSLELSSMAESAL